MTPSLVLETLKMELLVFFLILRNSDFFYLFIFGARCRGPLIIQTVHSFRIILKYQYPRSAEGIGKFEFVTKSQFLCLDILFNLRTQYLFPFYPRQQNEFMKTIKHLKLYLVSMVNYI